MRSNVVLPQPDGPSSAKNSPFDARLTLSTADHLAEALGDVAKRMIGFSGAVAPLPAFCVHGTHPLIFFAALLCSTIMTTMSTTVITIRMVEAALTSGVTEKRTIE